MISLFKKSLISCLAILLFACAGNDVKQQGSKEIFNKKVEYVDVESAIEEDFNKAVLLLNNEQYEQAITVFNSVIEREQRLPAPYVNIAMAYNKLGKTKSAEENLISALKLDISNPTANNELGLLYRKAGKFTAARTAYQNAIKEHSNYSPAKRNLGVLCDLYMHDYQCALEQFEDYLELEPNDKTVAIWVADVKRRLNQ